MNVYVYYKAPHSQRATLSRTIGTLIQSVHAACGISGAMLRRSQGESALEDTWMEVYEHVPPHFRTILEDCIAQSPPYQALTGERHIEEFEFVEHVEHIGAVCAIET